MPTALQIQARAELERRRRQRERQMHPDAHLSPADRELKRRCETNRFLFATSFFPHLCDTDFSSFHADLCELANSRVHLRGQRDVTAAPRGAAKTTWRKINILHDCVYEHEQYVLYVTNRGELAESHVREIRDELEFNQALLRVYGRQVGTLWNQGEIITAKGVHVQAASRASQVRGLVAQGARPSKVYVDDVEHPDHVVTQLQRDKTGQWFMGDIMKLGQPRTNYDVSGTILDRDSLVSRLLTNPGFQGRKYQAVLRFADASAVPLWQQWRGIFVNLDNPQRQSDARAFFEAHRAAMLAGSAVLWEARQSYYDLMVARLVEGETAFQLELMNNPQRSDRYLFDMEQAGYCRLMPDRLQRSDGRVVLYHDMVECVAYYDPTPDKQSATGDTAACVVLLKDASGYLYCVDAYVAVEPSTEKQMDAIVELLWQWQVSRFGIESNGFASLLTGQLRQKLAQRALDEGANWPIMLLPISNMRNKVLRIRSLDAPIVNRWLWFAESLPPDFFRQFCDFIPIDNAGRDDACDAVEGAYRVMQGLVDSRSPA